MVKRMSGKRKKENPLVQIHPRKPFFKRFWLDINRPIFGNKKIRIRFSRTSFPKPSLSWHPLRGFSLNTTHGARVSKTWKGLTLGFQNLNFVFRGRWSSGFFGLNLNASKSGFSLSQTNLLGSYNFSNPNRSSANILGIQIRGKKAAPWALLGLWISLPIHLFKLLIGLIQLVLQVVEVLLRIAIWILQLTWALSIWVCSLSWHLLIALACLVTPDSWLRN